MKQHISDIRTQTLSRIRQHSYYDEIQGVFETIAGHCERAEGKSLTIEVPLLGEFTISHKSKAEIEQENANVSAVNVEERKALGAALKEQRIALNLTQKQVVDGVGGDLTQKMLSDIERGVRDLPEQRDAIENYLESKADETENDEGENNDVE